MTSAWLRSRAPPVVSQAPARLVSQLKCTVCCMPPPHAHTAHPCPLSELCRAQAPEQQPVVAWAGSPQKPDLLPVYAVLPQLPKQCLKPYGAHVARTHCTQRAQQRAEPCRRFRLLTHQARRRWSANTAKAHTHQAFHVWGCKNVGSNRRGAMTRGEKHQHQCFGSRRSHTYVHMPV